MQEIGVRLTQLPPPESIYAGFVWIARRFVERKRHQASVADPIMASKERVKQENISSTRYRIIAFASEDVISAIDCKAQRRPTLSIRPQGLRSTGGPKCQRTVRISGVRRS